MNNLVIIASLSITLPVWTKSNRYADLASSCHHTNATSVSWTLVDMKLNPIPADKDGPSLLSLTHPVERGMLLRLDAFYNLIINRGSLLWMWLLVLRSILIGIFFLLMITTRGSLMVHIRILIIQEMFQQKLDVVEGLLLSPGSLLLSHHALTKITSLPSAMLTDTNPV